MSLSLADRLPLGSSQNSSSTVTTSIPRLGFGVYQTAGEECRAAVGHALAAGYRHIDSAQGYRNEADVCAGVQAAGVPRADVFLTTKIGRGAGTVDKTHASLVDSVQRLDGHRDGYVDLFLIHSAGAGPEARQELWTALERLHTDGQARSIGVSNFSITHIDEMRDYAKVWPPHVNQIELHPWCQQRKLVEYCHANNIVVEAYSPLVVGDRLKDPTLATVAAKHGKAPAQVLIRYSLQKGWVPLPKSANEDRIKQNADVFDFELDAADMKTLDDLDRGKAGAIFPANIR